MTPEQSAAYIVGMAACVNAEVSGMVAENQLRAVNGEPPAFVKADFDAVINRYGVHHNAICSFYQQFY